MSFDENRLILVTKARCLVTHGRENITKQGENNEKARKKSKSKVKMKSIFYVFYFTLTFTLKEGPNVKKRSFAPQQKVASDKSFTMSAAAVVLLSASSSLDNMSVGVSYAISKRYIDIKCNTAISLLNAIFTLTMMLAGSTFVDYVSPDTGSLMASIIFFLLGAADIRNFCLQMYASWYKKPSSPLKSETEQEDSTSDLEAPLLTPDDERIRSDSSSSMASKSRINSLSFDKSGTWTYVTYIQNKLVIPSDQETEVTCPLTPRTDEKNDIAIVSDLGTDQLNEDSNAKKKEEPEGGKVENEDNPLSVKWTRITLLQALVLAWATIFTNIAAGLAAGLAGYSVPWMTVGAFVASFVMLCAGQLIGAVFGGFIPERYLFLTSGLIFWIFALDDLPYVDLD